MQFERNVWLMVGRGTLHHDLYITPDALSEPQWALVADSLAWARDHAHILATSRMVLGDPRKREMYGFVSSHTGVAILCVRNPSPSDQKSIHASLQSLLSWDASSHFSDCTFDTSIVYSPANSHLRASIPDQLQTDTRFELDLAPFEVALLEFSVVSTATSCHPVQ